METLTLRRTQDRKTANLATPNGKASKIANAFSLPAGKEYSCPMATNFCDSICYAGKLERMYKGFRAVVVHNFDLLSGKSESEIFNLLNEMIQAFSDECDKRSANKLFRIHADGDFFSLDYAKAWARVMAIHSDIQFWAYTRVPFAAQFLHESTLPNLSLYFSGDEDNVGIAKVMENKGIKVAYVANTFAEAREAFKGVRCPEQNNKDFDLINEDGGACARCGLCVFNRGNVLFSVKGK